MNKYRNWRDDLQASCDALHSIKDTVLPCLISGTLHHIEQSSDHILAMMDKTSGIDIIRENENGLQGIAWRAQFGHAWNTFTIRYIRRTGAETEFEKRMKQIKQGYFYPAFTMQAYFDNEVDLNLLSVAIIKTKDFYEQIMSNPFIVKKRKSDNEFLYVDWADLNGIKVKTI